MRVRAVQPSDFEIANRWRRARRVPELDDSIMPKTGSACLDSAGEPIAFAWLYLSNSKLGYLAWPVTKPRLNPRVAHEALTLVVTELCGLAKALGIRSIMSTVASRGLQRLLASHGFLVTGGKHVMMSKGVE